MSADSIAKIVAEMREVAATSDHHMELWGRGYCRKWADRIERAAARGGEERLNRHAARMAANAIIADLADRRGLRQQWEQIDDRMKVEIRRTWINAILAAHAQELA